MVHYHHNIKNFGAPNGLCSSITESKHIAAVKRPWRRSSRYKALPQILKINERLDKLAAAKADFASRGMLAGSPLAAAILSALGDNGGGGGGGNDGNGNGNGNGNNGNGDSDSDSDIDNNGNDEAGPVESEPLMNEVRLACEKGNYYLFCMSSTSHRPFVQPPPVNTHQPLQPLERRLASTIYPILSDAFFSTNFTPIPTSNLTTSPSISARCYGTQESRSSTPPPPPSVLPATRPDREGCTGSSSIPRRGG